MAKSKQQGEPFTRRQLEKFAKGGGLAGRLAAALLENESTQTEPEQIRTSSNRDAERAVIYLVLTAKNEGDAGGLLEQLGGRDFHWPDTRFLFEEAAAMRKAGHPVNDAAAYRAWFSRPDSAERFNAAGFGDEWKYTSGSPAPLVMLLSTVMDGNFASWANAGWYVAELRRWRVSRGIRLLGTECVCKIEKTPAEPGPVLEWLEQQAGQLRKLCKQETKPCE